MALPRNNLSDYTEILQLITVNWCSLTVFALVTADQSSLQRKDKDINGSRGSKRTEKLIHYM